MRRAVVALVVILVGLGVFVGGVAWVFETPKMPAGASRAERTYLGLCATCHGIDGRGTWRATLFFIRPGNLADSTRQHTDQYLFDIVKHGGSPLGRPGMPGFGASLKDDDIHALVAYVRRLGQPAPARPGGGSTWRSPTTSGAPSSRSTPRSSAIPSSPA